MNERLIWLTRNELRNDVRSHVPKLSPSYLRGGGFVRCAGGGGVTETRASDAQPRHVRPYTDGDRRTRHVRAEPDGPLRGRTALGYGLVRDQGRVQSHDARSHGAEEETSGL